jgi:hypothetical protein
LQYNGFSNNYPRELIYDIAIAWQVIVSASDLSMASFFAGPTCDLIRARIGHGANG